MSNEVFAALLALVGSMAGSLGGILASARLTNFRLQQLEKKASTLSSYIGCAWEEYIRSSQGSDPSGAMQSQRPLWWQPIAMAAI